MSSPTLEARSVAVPFRHAFAHASARRTEAANVVVRVTAPDGLVGLGEGCPRDYVTGETVAGALAWLEGRGRAVAAEVRDLAGLRAWLAGDADDIDRNPSAACALELALLDLFARREGQPVEDLLGSPRLARPLKATAVYGVTSPLAFAAQRLRFLLAGMSDAKLKLTGDPVVDASRARNLARVRLDGNNLWSDADAAAAALQPAAPFAWAVEEPVAARDWAGMRRVAEATGLALVLDESFTRLADLHAAPDVPRLVNLRISKLGGVVRSLKALAEARARGFGIIVGAQVGETGVLARAGVLLAATAGEALQGFEGAYGTHLLARDVVRPSVTFDRRGSVVPGRTYDPAAAGWGLILEPWVLG